MVSISAFPHGAPSEAITLNFPARSVRQLPSRLNSQGVYRYYVDVSVSDVPQILGNYIDVNPRQATHTGSVPRRIRGTMTEDAEWFEFYNRGLLVLAETLSWDNQTNQVTMTFVEKRRHGLGDGNHSLFNVLRILNELVGEGLTSEADFTMEVILGVPEDRVNGLTDARNTSNQVRPQDLENHRLGFQSLKSALQSQGVDTDTMISWEENDPGEFSATEIIAILSMFNLSQWDDQKHPLQSYYGKAAVHRYFQAHKDEFEPLYPLASELLKIPEWIRHYLPEQQLAINSNFGGITGIRSAPDPLPLTGLSSTHTIPDAYIYPLTAAFRGMLINNNGTYEWGGGLSPHELIRDGVASEMFRSGVFPTISQLRNAMAVGKSVGVWGHAYSIMELRYLRAVAAGSAS